MSSDFPLEELRGLVRNALRRAIHGEADAPLMEAADLLVQAIAEHPELSTLLDVASFDDLHAWLDAGPESPGESGAPGIRMNPQAEAES